MTNCIVDTAVARKLKALGLLHGVKFTTEYGADPLAGKWTAIIVTLKIGDQKFRQQARTNIWPGTREEALTVAQAGVDSLVEWITWLKKGMGDVRF